MMEDLFPALAWLACSWLILRWSYDIALRVFPTDRPSELTLHVSVISIAVVVSGLTWLGAFGFFSFSLGLLTPPLLAYVLKRSVESGTPASIALSPVHRRWDPSAFFWIVVVAGLTGHSVVNGVMQFPREWDNLMYHFPFIDHWIQTGSFAAVETPRWSDPANSEVIGLWFALAFSGDFLVALNNLPIVIVWIAALLHVARDFGLDGRWPHLVALGAISVSVTLRQTMGASNDLMVPASFFACVAYGFRFLRHSRRGDLVLFGCTLGLLVGVKFFATGYGSLAGFTFALMCWSKWGIRVAMMRSVQVIGLSLLFGGYWFTRNLWMTGHLFYPQGSEDLRRRIPHPNLSQTTLLWNKDDRIFDLVAKAIWDHCGPLHTLLLAVLPVVVVYLCLSMFQNRSGRRSKHGVMLFLLIGTLCLALNTPMLVEDQPDTLNHLRWGYTPARYALTFLCMGILTTTVAGAQVLANASNRTVISIQLVFFVITVIQLWQQLNNPQRTVIFDWPLTVFASEIALVVYLSIFFASFQRKVYAHVLLVCLIGSGSILICFQSQRWHDAFAPYYDSLYSTSYFSESGSKPARILVLDDRSYPFFGSRRQNYVVQPMDFRSVDEVKQLMDRDDLSTAVAVKEVFKKVHRYRPAWDRLEVDPRFSKSASGKALRVFQVAED